MITELFFSVLFVMAFVLFLYMVIDNKNRIYGNIAAGFVSMILFFYQGWILLTGEIAVGETSLTSASLSTFCVMMGFIALIFFIGSTVEIALNYLKEV